MKQSIATVLALLCCLTSMAQWTKPAQPASQPLAEGEQVYLYNADADGFWLGANDWKTRASVSATRGYKMHVAQYVPIEGAQWDGVSYMIMTAIEEGGPAGKTLPAKLSDWNSIWVDAEQDNKDDKGWVFKAQGDGTYIIGLSPLNQRFNPEEDLQNACLGIIPEMKDTRVYLCQEGDGGYDFTTCKKRWSFVKETDYVAYVTAVNQYNAAVILGEDIAKAKVTFPSVDISSVEAVYNNHASTAEQLTAARKTLVDLTTPYASPTSPVDVTWLYVTNADYDNNENSGWSGDGPGFQNYKNAEFYDKNYNYYQTVTVPQGVYRVGVNAFYRASWADLDAEALTELLESAEGKTDKQNATIVVSSSVLSDHAMPLPFASQGATEEPLGTGTLQNSFGYIPNDMATAAEYMAAGRYPATYVTGMAGSDGSLTLGLKKSAHLGGDWTIFDSWKLQYIGNDATAYNYLKSEYLATETDYIALVENGDIPFYNHADYNAFKDARTALDVATTPEAISSALAELNKAGQVMAKDVEAYAAYGAKYLEAEAFIEEYGEKLEGEGMDNLTDYIQLEIAPDPSYPLFPNGSALYILNNGILSAEEITAEITLLQKLIDAAMASGMKDGTDCTELIKNQHFAEEGIWNKEGFPAWPKGTGSYKVAEGFSILFNVNQTITGLQNGLYELSLNDFFRPADFSAAEYSKDNYRAYVYMNSDEAKLNLIDNGATEERFADDDAILPDGGFVPNSVDGAAKAFEAGRYKQTLFGLVTDGTLKIGIRNDLRYENCWGVWSDFRLIFRAKNPQVLASVIASSLPNAEAKLNNKCGTDELDQLQTTITNAMGEPEDGYQALVDLKNAMAAVDLGTETYVQMQTAISTADATLADYAGKTSKELTALKNITEQAKAAYESGSLNNAGAADMVASVNAAVVAVKMGGETTEEKDVSDLIVNNTFDPARGSKDTGTIEGWITSAMNGYKQNTVSYNKAAIDLKQTLYGLPAGHYRLTAHTYYRAGYYDEEWTRKENGEDTHLTTLYAATPTKTFETKVKNLYEDAQPAPVGTGNCYTLPNGLFAPDGTSPTVEFFNAGFYLNTLEFDVAEDGTDVTIGLRKTEILPNDYEVVGKWNLYYTPSTTPEPKDVSNLIVNNTFDPARGSKDTGEIEGWITSAMNGYKQNTVSYNKAAINLYQTLYGLPAGDYKVTVHTYYRAGYYDEEWTRKENGEETHLTTLYAATSSKTYETKVKNLYEDAQPSPVGTGNCYTLPNGLYAPDGTTPTVEFFNAGHYLNELNFTVTETSDVTIGLKKTETLPNDYEVVGKWNLYYLGAPTSILPVADEINPANSTITGYYNISGVRLDAPQRGVNIVKMSDGKVKKIFVK